MLIVGVLAIALPAQGGSSEREVLQTAAPQLDGDARWTERLERGVGFGYCRSNDCAMFYLVLRNDSAVALQCVGRMEVAPSPHAQSPADLREEHESVIQPGDEDTVVSLAGDARSVPQAHSSSCRSVHPAAALTTPAGCEAQFDQVDKLPDYYPPGSIRRQEQGSVTVEFTLAAELAAGSDVELATSSGYPALDAAALKIFRSAALRTHCAGQRFSKSLHFSLVKEAEAIDASYWRTEITPD